MNDHRRNVILSYVFLMGVNLKNTSEQFVADQISSGEEVTECWFPRAATSSSQMEAPKEEQAAKEEAASEEEAPTKKQKSSG